jgi:hypothetical protein
MKILERTRWKQEKVEFDPLANLKRWVDKGCFFSMTHVNKLGINPQSHYDTPLGIYAYPLNQEFYDMLVLKQLPFQMEAPYIQIFIPKPNANIINLDFDEQKFDELYSILKKEVDGWTGDSKYFENIYKKAVKTAYETEPASIFWNLTRLLANKNPLKWRSLFMSIGIDGFYDPGLSIIHKNEPSQAVFFKLSALEHLDALVNPVLKNKKPPKLEIFKTQIENHNVNWIANILNHFENGSEIRDLLKLMSRNLIIKILSHPKFPSNFTRPFMGEYLFSATKKPINNEQAISLIKTLVKTGKINVILSQKHNFQKNYSIFTSSEQKVVDIILPIMNKLEDIIDETI